MSEQRTGTNEAERIPPTMNRSGTRDPRPLPGINVRELYAERNWAALAGLALVVVGLLFLVQDVLDLDGEIWGLVSIGIGGLLIYDAWKGYSAGARRWSDRSRNRMTGGVVLVSVGLLATFELDFWALLLLGLGVWLGWDAWKRYTASGRTWTDSARNRMFAGVSLALLAVFTLFELWSTWPLILIVVGVVMLYGHLSDKR